MMNGFYLERCDIYGFHTLCDYVNQKTVPEKILIALDREWDREKIREYVERFTWEDIAKGILEIYMVVTGEAPK